MAEETGVPLGGTLTQMRCLRPGGPAPTDVDRMRHNLGMFTAARA